MSPATLAGSLTDFPLGDLLQFVALSRRTGRIDLRRGDDKAVVVMRTGRLLYAASGSAKESLGHQLVTRGLVTPQDLERALTRHRRDPDGHLGNALVEMGLLDAKRLAALIEDQLEQVVAELMLWTDGSFSFTPLRLADHGEVEVDAGQLGFEGGFPTDEVLLRVTCREDEWTESFGPSEAPPWKPRAELSETSLRSIIAELALPLVTSEVTVRILGHARRQADRGLLFATRTDGFSAIGHFGIDGSTAEGAEGKLPELRIPLAVPSILEETTRRGRRHRRDMPETRWDRVILEALGPGSHGPGAAIPLAGGGHRSLLVLYLDNHLTELPLPNLAHLESQVQEASRSLEPARS